MTESSAKTDVKVTWDIWKLQRLEFLLAQSEKDNLTDDQLDELEKLVSLYTDYRIEESLKNIASERNIPVDAIREEMNKAVRESLENYEALKGKSFEELAKLVNRDSSQSIIE